MMSFIKKAFKSPKNLENPKTNIELSPRDLIKRERSKALKICLMAIVSTNICLLMILMPTEPETTQETPKQVKEFNREIIL